MRRTGLLAVAGGVVIALTLVMFLGPSEVTDPAAEALARDSAERAAAEARRVTSTVVAPTTTATPRPVRIAPDQIHATAMELLAAPDPAELTQLLAAMGEAGDTRWLPYILDLRLYATPEVFLAGQHALQQITGDDGPDDLADAYRYFGNWVYDNSIDPGSEYIDFKATLYAAIDSRFGELLRQVGDPALVAQIQWGGVLVGGIPELNDQKAITVAQADYMLADELTFGAVVNGEARSYPHRILDHHELANDTLGGEPVSLVNCTLCRTGVLYSRRVGDDVLDFQTSGLLWNSNKVMIDVQTGSLWQQLTGEAFAGEHRGVVLARYPVTVTRFGDWVAEHPDTEVVSIPADGRYSYEPGDAYADYYADDDLWFATFSAPTAFAAKAEMATLNWEGEQLAVEVASLSEEGSQVFVLGESTIVAIPTGGGARFYRSTSSDPTVSQLVGAEAGEATLILPDGTELERLVSGQSFWFAWYASYPDTQWWPAP